MKTILTAAALLLLTTAANANPTLPREFQGSWCGTEDETGPNVRGDINTCRPHYGFIVKPTELSSSESDCAVAYVKPAKNGRYHVTFACTHPAGGEPIEITHFWMRDYNGALYMQRVNSTFTKPSKS